ncbi:MAG: hypothetical protein V1676_00900 [Candidatus Diapherotrites archaeon]
MALRIAGALLAAIGAAAIGATVAILGIIAIFFFAIIGALMGAVTGLILSIVPVLGALVVSGFAQVGVTNPDLPAIGAMLGFVAGFFKSVINQGSSCNCSN